MYYASLLGIGEIVRWLEDQGLDFNMLGGRYGFPLQAAIVGNHENIVTYLIARNVKVAQTGGQFGAAIVAAAARSSLRIVQLLLKADVDVKVTDPEGKTALHYAAGRGDLSIMTELMLNGADMNAESTSKETPLMVASYNGCRDATKLLVDRGAKLDIANVSRSTALHLAMPNEDIACDLITAGIPIDTMNDKGSTPLLIAAASCDGLKTISLLVQRSSNVSIANHKGWTPLHYAAFRDSPDAARLLLEAGADVTATTNRGTTASTFAAGRGKLETLQLLLEWFKKTKKLTDASPTPLNTAVEEGQDHALKVLLDHGISFKYISELNQRSAYDAALRMERLDIAKDFVARGCFRPYNHDQSSSKRHPTEHISREDERIVAMVAFEGDIRCVEEAIMGVQGYNIADALSEALCVACSRGFTSIAELLIKHGAAVLWKDLNKRTPLHHALAHYHTKVATLLIEQGASLTVEDSIGSTPFDLAVQGGQICLDFIKTHMVVLGHGLNRRPSLLEHVHQKNKGVSAPPSRIREILIGQWTGQYEYLSWRENNQESFGFNVVAEACLDSFDTAHGFITEEGKDEWGKFNIFGLVDTISIIWFVKLYAKRGWLYRGQIQGDSGKLKGTWGSNRRLWHGIFHLSKTPLDNSEMPACKSKD